MDSSPLLRPIPRRAFDLTPTSGNSTSPPTPSPTHDGDESMIEVSKTTSNESAPSQTRSILNLTSSTLFGIYAPSDEPSTPWGNGAQTPSYRPSIDEKRPPTIGAFSQQILPKPQLHHSVPLRDTVPSIARRTILLFLLGVAYGIITKHLHDDQHLAPIKVEGIERYSKWYLVTWGIAGVLLGTLLPWVDTFWEERLGEYEFDLPAEGEKHRQRSISTSADDDERPASPSGNDLGADWTPVIRSIGAFIGIAFAIVCYLSLHYP